MFKLRYEEICKKIEEHKKKWLNELRQVVRIRSLPSNQEQQDQMIQWFVNKLCQFNAECEVIETTITTTKNEQLKPQLILGHLKLKKAEKTLLIYGHIDINEKKNYQLQTKLSELSVLNGKIYGRGLAYGKGSLICWLHAIEALYYSRQKPSINIKFVIETMRTANSLDLEKLISMRQQFFQDINYVCLMENTTDVTQLPVICYCSPGCANFVIELEIPKSHDRRRVSINLQLLQELGCLINKLTYDDGSLCLPSASFPQANVKKVGDSVEKLKAPRLIMHGVKGSFYHVNMAKLIPTHVFGNFSIEFGPEYDVAFLTDFIATKLADLYSLTEGNNILTVTVKKLMKPWLIQSTDPNMLSLKRALAFVDNVEIKFAANKRPHIVAHILREYTKADVIIFNLFSQKPKETEIEFVEELSYWNAIKQLSTYLFMLGIYGVEPQD